MEHTATSKPRPLVLGVALSVIFVSLLGAVAISGLLPGADPEKNDASAPNLARELTIPERESDCASCGTVQAVRVFEVKGSVDGLRTGARGAGGALIGNQPGGARENTPPTVRGADAGALAGNQIEKNVQKRVSYRVTVRMDDGSFRTVSQSTAPNVAVGDRVRIANGALVGRS